MGINYNTKLLSFSRRNTAKHFRILREKGKWLLTASLGWMLIIPVEHSERGWGKCGCSVSHPIGHQDWAIPSTTTPCCSQGTTGLKAAIKYIQLKKVPIELTTAMWPSKGLEAGGRPRNFIREGQGLPPTQISLPQSQSVSRNAVIPLGPAVLGFSKAPFTFHLLPCSLNLVCSGETQRSLWPQSSS